NHIYDQPGSYTMGLVVDEDGTHLAGTFMVNAAESRPPSDIRISHGVAEEGRTTRFTMSFTDPDLNDNHTVVIKWGDQKPDTTVHLSGPRSVVVDHVYLNDGTYSVGVTVTDRIGRSALGSTDVTVANLAPVVGPISGTTSLIPGQMV